MVSISIMTSSVIQRLVVTQAIAQEVNVAGIERGLNDIFGALINLHACRE
jgi:hypothetical protein